MGAVASGSLARPAGPVSQARAEELLRSLVAVLADYRRFDHGGRIGFGELEEATPQEVGGLACWLWERGYAVSYRDARGEVRT